MNLGFIKLHRQILDSSVFNDAKLLKIFIWCLLRANHKDTKILGDDYQEVELKRGQFVFGLISASEKLNMPKSSIYRMIKRLESLGLVTRKVGSRFSIVSVCKYSSYQDSKNEVGMKLERSWNEVGMKVETDKNDKNVRMKEEREAATHSQNDFKRFEKPNLDQLQNYWKLKEYSGALIEPMKMFNYYESNGWRAGRHPMKNWQRAADNWNLRSKQFDKGGASVESKPTQPTPRCNKCRQPLVNGECYHCIYV